MNKLTPQEFHEIRNKIYNDLLVNNLITDEDVNYSKIDFILGERLPIDWEKDKINIKEITIHWAEGNNSNYDKFPKTYSSYVATNEALKPIYYDIVSDGLGGYNKVKFSLLFEDGETYDGKLYISEKDDNPTLTNNTIGEHIKKHLNWVIEKNAIPDMTEVNQFLNNYNLDI